LKAQSLFITGTDTGVGKTLVTALLALRLQAQGVDVAVMKPFASGCLVQNGELLSEDALWLHDVTGVEDDLELINPIRYEEPLAPLMAARRIGRATSRDFDIALGALGELQRRHECVLVEGVGGLLVPIAEDNGRVLDCTDFAARLGFPGVVVARRTLGTINHTLLTCRTPLQSPARFEALLFCDAAPIEEDDVAAQSGPALIREITGLPVWGRVPYLADVSRETLIHASRQHLLC
jgi:dethiobiotin synthetase